MLNIDFRKTELFLLKLFILVSPTVVYKYVFYFRASQFFWVKFFTIVLLTVYLVSLIKPGQILPVRITKIYLPIILFILAMLISNWINSTEIPIDLEQVVIYANYFILFFLMINFVDNEEQFNQFILLLFFCILCSIITESLPIFMILDPLFLPLDRRIGLQII